MIMIDSMEGFLGMVLIVVLSILCLVAVGWFIWVTGIITLSFLRVVWLRPARARILDYRVFAPPLSGDETMDQRPLLTLSLEIHQSGQSCRHELTEEASRVLMSLGHPEHTASYWFDRADWDRHLLGQELPLRFSPFDDVIILPVETKEVRWRIAIFLVLLLVFVKLTWWVFTLL